MSPSGVPVAYSSWKLLTTPQLIWVLLRGAAEELGNFVRSDSQFARHSRGQWLARKFSISRRKVRMRVCSCGPRRPTPCQPLPPNPVHLWSLHRECPVREPCITRPLQAGLGIPSTAACLQIADCIWPMNDALTIPAGLGAGKAPHPSHVASTFLSCLWTALMRFICFRMQSDSQLFDTCQ